ncbi:hypothetical protein BH10ACI2_BH10ACI2_05060 [soil metagenome]
MSRQMKVSTILIIIFVGCVLTAPVLIYGISPFSDDGAIHAAWYINFSDQLWAGTLYPRWLPGLNGGLGSPTFFYYPPVAFFLTSLLKPFFSNDITGVQQVGVSASAAIIASGVFAYLWLRELVDPRSVVICAILYMITPYHLVSDLYVRSSFAELWAFVWLPLILYFTHQVSKNHRFAFVGLAISYSLLIMTHLPTTLIFSLIPLGYVVVEAEADQKLRRLLVVSGAMLVGIGLSGIYLYPAMTTQSYVFIDRLTIGYFSYKNWLFFSRVDLWTIDKIRILLLVIDLAVVACCAYAVIRRSNLNKNIKKLGLFWFAVALASILMMTDLSRPVWDIVTPLQKLQFPWRFNVILSLAITALCALAISSIKNSPLMKISVVRILALISIFIWIPSAAYGMWWHFAPEVAPTAVLRGLEAPEYRPRWSRSMAAMDWEMTKDEDLWDAEITTEYKGLMERTGASEEDPPRFKIVEGAEQANVISWKPREILLHAVSSSVMKVRISQFYFPNWRATDFEKQREFDISPSEPDGLITLELPSGDQTISFTLEKSREEWLGQSLSLAAALGLSLYVLIAALYRPKKLYSNQ